MLSKLKRSIRNWKIGYHILESLSGTTKDLQKLSPLPALDSDSLTLNNWCYHKETEVFKRRTTISPFHRFPILRCKKCGVGFRHHFPPPQTIYSIYDGPDYYYDGYLHSFTPEGRPLIEERNQLFLNYLRAAGVFKYTFPNDRYFELGCGTGFSLLAMKELGWQPFGMDLSSWAINYIKTDLHINDVYCASNVRDLQFPQDNFAFIFFGHVIEHLLDPFATLKELSRILTSAGLLFLITPDMDRDYYNNYIKDHLWFFNEYSLKYWLSVVGLRNIKILRDGIDIHVLDAPYLLVTATKPQT